MSAKGPSVWDGWMPGDCLPAEIQVIVDRTVRSLLAVWLHPDGSPVFANERKAA